MTVSMVLRTVLFVVLRCPESSQSTRWNRLGTFVSSHGIQIALPPQFAAKASEFLLLAKTEQGTQAKFHCFALGLEASDAQRRFHQYQHGQGVLTYLARYVRGGPLKNTQIAEASADHVTFRYRSHRKTEPGLQSLRLAPTAFLLRYLQHTPLPNTPIVRHYGLYATRHEAALNQARAAHAQCPAQPPPPVTWQAHYERRAGQPTSITHCPHCGHVLVCLGTLPKPLKANQQAPPP